MHKIRLMPHIFLNGNVVNLTQHSTFSYENHLSDLYGLNYYGEFSPNTSMFKYSFGIHYTAETTLKSSSKYNKKINYVNNLTKYSSSKYEPNVNLI